jgi:hypothetical protein
MNMAKEHSGSKHDRPPELAASFERVAARLRHCRGFAVLESGLFLVPALRVRADPAPMRPTPMMQEKNSDTPAIPTWLLSQPNYWARTVTIQRPGFRGEEIAVPKPAHRFRIVALGESTTYGVGVPTYREAYPYQLERHCSMARTRGGGNAGAEDMTAGRPDQPLPRA